MKKRVLSLTSGVLLAAAAATAADTIYVPADEVAAAFATGGVLYDAGGSFMVHASRRDVAGQAEVHAKDTDVIYVLGGAATFVTGGSVVGATASAPDEIRGASIADGAARRLAAGDVIIVPAGTPHWFQAIETPITYHVVKVR
jgi:mannose-6-phosphate isomerase-like protein (cupin superfamily)